MLFGDFESLFFVMTIEPMVLGWLLACNLIICFCSSLVNSIASGDSSNFGSLTDLGSVLAIGI